MEHLNSIGYIYINSELHKFIEKNPTLKIVYYNKKYDNNFTHYINITGETVKNTDKNILKLKKTLNKKFIKFFYSDTLIYGDCLTEKESDDVRTLVYIGNKYYKEKTKDFKTELEELINKHSKKNGSDIPDFILATYIEDCLVAFDNAVKHRDNWYKNKFS